MAKFTASVPLNMHWGLHEIRGSAGATHRIDDALADEFAAGPGAHIPGFAWVVQDEASDSLTISQSIGSSIQQTGVSASAGSGNQVARANHVHRTIGSRRATRANTIDAAVNSAPIAIAHRGWSRCAPENTLESIGLAISGGARVIETDVVWSADGVPMILHDTTLDRTVATYSGSPANFTAAQLRKMDAGTVYSSDFSAQGIPTLYDLFNLYGDRTTWIIEIKANYPNETVAQTADRLAAIIDEYGLNDYCIIASFSYIGDSIAWSTYGIPFLRYTGTLAADGSISGTAASSLYAVGYRYIGHDYSAANVGTGGNAVGAAGIKLLLYTVPSRYYRDVAIASTTALVGVITDDWAYLEVGRTISIPVGSTFQFSGPKVVPSSVVPFRKSGSAKVVDQPSEGGRIGWSSGRLGWPTVNSTTDQDCMVIGALGWGASGLGKLSADINVEATTNGSRFGGITVHADDRGHVSGAGSDTSPSYSALLRQSGTLELFRMDADGSEISIGSATSTATLSAGNAYTVTLEITATNVIATGNSLTVNVADATYRNLNYCGLVRSQLGVTFSNVKRIT